MQEILVGVDGSPAGEAALRFALEESLARRTGVIALQSWQLPYTGSYGLYPPVVVDVDLAPEVQRRLEESVARVRESVPVRVGAGGSASPPTVSAVAVRGPASQVIEEQARAASLLVLGRHERSAAARVVLGSVVGAALHHVDCPVAIVPETWQALAPSARVLVGVAEGEASDGALAWAADFATRHDRTLVPVLVRQPSDPGGPDWPDAADLDASALAELTRQAHGLSTSPLTAAVRPEVLVGSPGAELTRFATPEDVLVVGSRGRGALAGWLLGSTSSHVAHHADCPVVVVRQPDRPSA